MRHLKAGRKFKRSPAHRRMMLRNLTTAVLEHGKITTTLAKAKEVQPLVEKMITLAKGGWDLNKFRRINAFLTSEEVAFRLFKEYRIDDQTYPPIAERFRDRPGGYTRIYKLAKVRQGDASPMAVLALLSADEKVAARPVRPVVAPAKES
ncbi:MAG: 50S ribosomal protein L17 [Isosphaeraceae bacterium]|jgi:large subunit ribosomal protein L17|nr:MAG: 50S ribosomal protein L17 [Isosphaeraceae bacterium]